MTDYLGCLTWDLPAVAQSLKISEEQAVNYFTDGRRVSFILERRIAYELIDGEISPSEGASFDVKSKDGTLWEIRSITRSGMYFCPSYMVGSQRSFDEPGFLIKLDQIAGYIVSDVTSFPKIPVWKVSRDEVRNWWQSGRLGTTTKISRTNVLRLLAPK